MIVEVESKGGDSKRYWGIVPAAGSGSRMQQSIPKQYSPLADSTVLEVTLRRLQALQFFESILVPIRADDTLWNTSDIATDNFFVSLEGGTQRSDSVMAGLLALEGQADSNDWVLVHDAARPCFHRSDIKRMVELLADHPVGGLMAMPILDSVKRVDAGGTVIKTLDRKQLWRAQTPQMFRYGLIREALEEAIASESEITDEASAVELKGLMPVVVRGSENNIKITLPADLALAEYYLASENLDGE